MNIFPGIKLNSTDNKLNIFSFIFLLMADIFIMTILFFALSEQISQFSNEYDYFPYNFRSMLIDQKWVENNIVENITETVVEQTRSTAEKRPHEMHPVCQAIQQSFDAIIADKVLMERVKLRDRLWEQYDNIDYDRNRTAEAKALFVRISALDRELMDNEKIKKTVTLIFKSQKADYREDLIRFNKIFALKRTLFDFIFILPFLFILIMWNRRAMRADRELSVVISSHLILVALVPLMFEFIRLIIEVIPKVLLKTIYDFLLRFKLISFWYYAVLLISIGLIGFIIWLLQTKVFTKKRMQRRRYERSRCMSCSSKIDYRGEFCPVCGRHLFIKCPECKKLTVDGLDYCQVCGKGINS